MRKAEKMLLERLFAATHALGPAAMGRLLAEGPSVVAARGAAASALEDVKTAAWKVNRDYQNSVYLRVLCFALPTSA